MTGMYDPAHPGEIIREAIEAERWTVTPLCHQKNAVACSERQG